MCDWSATPNVATGRSNLRRQGLSGRITMRPRRCLKIGTQLGGTQRERRRLREHFLHPSHRRPRRERDTRLPTLPKCQPRHTNRPRPHIATELHPRHCAPRGPPTASATNLPTHRNDVCSPLRRHLVPDTSAIKPQGRPERRVLTGRPWPVIPGASGRPGRAIVSTPPEYMDGADKCGK